MQTTISSKVRDLRVTRGWTQQEVADAVGVTQGAIGHIETGRVTPSVGLLLRLAAHFGVPVSALIDSGAGEPEKQPAM